MKTIIIPTDFSENSLKAVDFAFDFFNQEGNQFILCHFYDIPRGGTSALFTLLEQLKKQAEKDMLGIKEWVQERHSGHAVNLTTKVLKGTVYDCVKDLGAETKADFVVMGNKGATGMREILIGSNASKLLRDIKIPVFAIPEDYQKEQIEELFFSYDGKSINEESVQVISSFSKSNQLPIQLLHVRDEEEMPIQNWSKIANQFGNQHISLHEIFNDSYEEGIKSAINNAKCILTLIRREKSIWEQLINKSDSQKAVRHLSIPILVIPEK